jgi:hypothetical protein
MARIELMPYVPGNVLVQRGHRHGTRQNLERQRCRHQRRDLRSSIIPPKIEERVMSNENTGRLFICGEHSEIREASNDEIVTAAREIMNRKIRSGTSMASPKLVKDFLSVKLGSLEHETFCVMLSDSK